MNGTRVSIGGLLAIVLFAALGLAALRSPTDLWVSLVNTAALAVLGFALLGALLRRGPSRAFWLGFVVFGGGYLALAGGPQTARRLPTTPLLDWLRAVMSLSPRSPGDRLLVVRQGSPAPAMVLEVKDGTYKVNFDGWTSYHDEWIGPDRVVGTLPAAAASAGTNPPPLAAFLPFTGTENFLLIGHSLLALLVGMVGGLVARFSLCDRDESRDAIAARAPFDVGA